MMVLFLSWEASYLERQSILSWVHLYLQSEDQTFLSNIRAQCPIHEQFLHPNSNLMEFSFCSNPKWGDHYEILHMAWQLCCHCIRKNFVAIWFSIEFELWWIIFLKSIPHLSGANRMLSIFNPSNNSLAAPSPSRVIHCQPNRGSWILIDGNELGTISSMIIHSKF